MHSGVKATDLAEICFCYVGLHSPSNVVHTIAVGTVDLQYVFLEK